MRITSSQLRKIIAEELNRALNESSKGLPFPADARKKSKTWKAKFVNSRGEVVKSLDVSIVFEMLYADMIGHIEDDPGAYITLTSADGRMGPYVLSTSDDVDNFANQESGQ